ncbi:MAG TPA: lysophospholipid acyltransferase family protein, partial [Vulgatibacter sp.]
NWELLFRRIVTSGRPAYAVGAELSHGGLTAIVEKVRGPGRTIWRGAEGASRKLLRAFREDAFLAMLIDQDTKVQGVFVPFFGHLAHTPRAAADLARRTGAGVVTVFIHRKPGGGHRIAARRIEWTPGADADRDAVALTAAMTAAIEEAIRASPHEWVWMHRRWKTRPGSQADGRGTGGEQNGASSRAVA